MNKINQLREERPVKFWYVASYLAVLPTVWLLPSGGEASDFFEILLLTVYLPLSLLTLVIVVPIFLLWGFLRIWGFYGVLALVLLFGPFLVIGWKIGGFTAKALPNEHSHGDLHHRHAGAHHYHYHPHPNSDAYIVL